MSSIPPTSYTLACPSYIIPGTYAENLRYLKDEPRLSSIGAMELLFFLFDDQMRELLDVEWPTLAAERGALRFTLHMPDPVGPEHEELITKTSTHVSHYVLHPPKGGVTNFRHLVERWRERYGDRFLLENLIDRPHGSLFEETDWPLCMDTGHLLVQGEDPARFFYSYGDRIRQIHLHAVRGEADHLPLDLSEPWLEELYTGLGDFRGIVELELFSIDHILRSLEVLGQLDTLRDMRRMK